MTKDQLKEAKIIEEKINRIRRDILQFKNDRRVSLVSIETVYNSGYPDESKLIINFDASKRIVKNQYANGICDDPYLAKAEMLANGYIESMITLLNDQLKSLEDQFEKI